MGEIENNSEFIYLYFILYGFCSAHREPTIQLSHTPLHAATEECRGKSKRWWKSKRWYVDFCCENYQHNITCHSSYFQQTLMRSSMSSSWLLPQLRMLPTRHKFLPKLS